MSSEAFTPLSYPRLRGDNVAARAQAVADGYAEGLGRAAREEAAARKAAREAEAAARKAQAGRVASALTALHQAVERLDARLAPVAASADRALVQAALGLAEAVLRREVAQGHANAEDALRRVLDTVPSGRIVTVHLNPNDLDTLRAAHLAEAAVAPASTLVLDDGLRIVADAEVDPADATAELRHGWLDARIGAALARAREVLEADL
ncbi:MAG TPA: FliH/SctL family protein [Microbacteriaceae bacterium]|nr:FliH/SctL family protein [Microbacteriaceae bacterium]